MSVCVEGQSPSLGYVTSVGECLHHRVLECRSSKFCRFMCFDLVAALTTAGSWRCRNCGITWCHWYLVPFIAGALSSLASASPARRR